MKRNDLTVAVVGATGAVGTEMLRVLEERGFPCAHIKLLASERSVGKKLCFRGREHAVELLAPDAFEGVDIALFSAGGARSLEFAPHAVGHGAVVVDNSSAFRMDPKVPLVVPEVNPEAVRSHRGIIANPNCSTIVLLTAVEPIRRLHGLRRMIVATYQSVSGAGAKAIHQLWQETNELSKRWPNFDSRDAVSQIESKVRPGLESEPVMAHRIAFNLIPHIDVFQSDGYTKEELKMREESRKILALPKLRVSATCVRVPVYLAHSEAVTLELRNPADLNAIRKALKQASGVVYVDAPKKNEYPMPLEWGGRDAVGVGRLRRDPDDAKVVHFWCVGDNLRKGAATNAVQIAELLLRRG